MQEGSEKYLTGNLGECLKVLDHLLLLLLHLKYTISPTIVVTSATLASANPTIASVLWSQDRGLFPLSEFLRPAVTVVAAMVVGFWVVVLLPGKTGEICKLFTKGLLPISLNYI